MNKELRDKIANSMIEKGGLIGDDLEMIYQQGRADERKKILKEVEEFCGVQKYLVPCEVWEILGVICD